MKADCVVIGGGLVGLATAYRLLEHRPGLKLVLLEKEARLAQHQSSRNSGVLHTGVYYKPGSFKAKLCFTGRQQAVDFADRTGVPYKLCGKLIVATTESERPRLDMLYSRAKENGVAVTSLDANQIREREPHVKGVAGFWVHNAGVIDFPLFAERLADEIRKLGGNIVLDAELRSIQQTATGRALVGTFDPIETKLAVNCAGLHSDRIASLFGATPGLRIIPFRGEYYMLKEPARPLCRTLIYPVPDPQFPFLGVHFTRGIHDDVECGPNAVLAFAREGYSWKSIDPRFTASVVTFPGFRRLIRRHWKMGLFEMYRSLSKSAFVSALQQLIPEVRDSDLLPGGSGVRAQAVRPDGSLEDDFAFHESPGAVHVLNAPSPAATSCLAIGSIVAERALAQLK